jgi:hypothetical protein
VHHPKGTTIPTAGISPHYRSAPGALPFALRSSSIPLTLTRSAGKQHEWGSSFWRVVDGSFVDAIAYHGQPQVTMPTIRTGPAPLTPSGKVRIAITVTPAESAAIDAVRGTVPASTWVRDVAVQATKARS